MLPTSTDVTVGVKGKVPADVEAVGVFVGEDGKHEGEFADVVTKLRAAGTSRGKLGEVAYDLAEAGKGKYRRVYVVGLGKDVNAEAARKAGGALAKALKKGRIGSIVVVSPAGTGMAGAVVTGMLLASFEYREYRGKAKEKEERSEGRGQSSGKKPLMVTVVGGSDVEVEVGRAIAICEGQNFARTIAFRPGNDINPPRLAEVATSMAKEVGVACRVLDEKEMKKLGMGGILAVGGGSSATPPRMIVLEYDGRGQGSEGRGQKKKKKDDTARPVLVVGKAITFDTGGVSIKPAERMGRMVFDKCGGMAVLGLMVALARLKAPVHVVGILSSAENHISETAYRPGDILRMYSGVTVEVTNTDAEGRLVLADALAWGIETYKPSAVVDLATLTGGVVVALGNSMAGVMCNDDALFAELAEAGKRSGEKFWRLPVSADVREQIKSDVADVVNSAGRNASPLQGSEFLRCFIPEEEGAKVPWAHFDIAGVADSDKEGPYWGKGATGWGVRTLVEWVVRSGQRAEVSEAGA